MHFLSYLKTLTLHIKQEEVIKLEDSYMESEYNTQYPNPFSRLKLQINRPFVKF